MSSSTEILPKLHIAHPHHKIVVENSGPLAVTKDIWTDKILIRRANEIPLSDDWDDIPVIHQTRGVAVEKSENLVFVVELPLLRAARMLFDAGIVTTESNAHFEEDEDEAVILLGISWESLSQLQQNQAEHLCQTDGERWKHYLAGEHGDGYEALYLSWRVHKQNVLETPRKVKAYVDEKVSQLIQGRVVISSPH